MKSREAALCDACVFAEVKSCGGATFVSQSGGCCFRHVASSSRRVVTRLSRSTDTLELKSKGV